MINVLILFKTIRSIRASSNLHSNHLDIARFTFNVHVRILVPYANRLHLVYTHDRDSDSQQPKMPKGRKGFLLPSEGQRRTPGLEVFEFIFDHANDVSVYPK